MRLDFHADVTSFWPVARRHLEADPVVGSVLTTYAERLRAEPGLARPDDWWLVVRDDAGAVVGAGMRTAPFWPHPAFLLPMPADAAVLLARTVHERGEHVVAANGALGPVRAFAEETARLVGGRVVEREHSRLFELGTLVSPTRRVPGRLRVARVEEVEQVEDWLAAFSDDADEQAGRPRGSGLHAGLHRPDVLARLRSGRTCWWEDGAGRPVSLAAAGPSSLGVARIGPVYTPPEQRGRGWASAAVHAVSAGLLEGGDRVCLYTDQANPVSNAIYERLGFEPVVDNLNVAITRPDGS